MRRSVAIVLACGGLGIAAFVLGAGSAQPDRILLRADDPETVTLGAEIYAAECAECHGANLEGQRDWRERGPDGRLPAPPHDRTGHTWHHDGTALFRLTKYGIGEMIGDPDYVSNMPAYDGVLTDKDIAAVLSYIKSTWPDEIRAHHDSMEEQR